MRRHPRALIDRCSFLEWFGHLTRRSSGLFGRSQRNGQKMQAIQTIYEKTT